MAIKPDPERNAYSITNDDILWNVVTAKNIEGVAEYIIRHVLSCQDTIDWSKMQRESTNEESYILELEFHTEGDLQVVSVTKCKSALAKKWRVVIRIMAWGLDSIYEIEPEELQVVD